MVEAGLVPREYTYKLVLDALTSEGMMVHKRMRQGIDQRYRSAMEIKPVMSRKEDFHKNHEK